MTKPIKLITFDFFDTLVRPKLSIGHYYSIVGKKYGFDIDSKHLNDQFLKSYKHFTKKFPNMGYAASITSFDWWKLVVLDTFSNCQLNTKILNDQFDPMFEELYKEFTNIDNYHLFDDVKPLLNKLKSSGHPIQLGVVSNMDERCYELLKNFELSGYFDYVILSKVCGLVKPDPKIYSLVNELSTVDPKNCIHIGDDYDKDFVASERAGWKGYWLQRDTLNNLMDTYNVPKSQLLTKLTDFQLNETN